MKTLYASIALMVLLLGLGGQAAAWAQEAPEETNDMLSVRTKGFVDSYHALGLVNGQWMASRTQVRGELQLGKWGANAFVSLMATANGLLPSESSINLREAYLSYATDNFTLCAGRRIIIWGLADALRVTDIVSPLDLTEFITKDFDEIRTPVNVIECTYSNTVMSVTAIAIPIPNFYTLPTQPDNPWTPFPAGQHVQLDLSSHQPPLSIKSAEYGGRIRFFLPSVDFSLCALRTWNKMPVFSYTRTSDGLALAAHHARMTLVGGDLSVSAGPLVLRAEAAAYLHEAQSPLPNQEIQFRHTLHGLIGIDWYAPHEWTLSAQYLHNFIPKAEELPAVGNAGMATLRIAKNMLGNTLTLSNFAYFDVTHIGLFNRISAHYAFSDQLSGELAYDLFYAKGGMFFPYRNNSQLWVRLRFAF